MNYKPLINIKLKEYQEEFPEYTLGEILYSMLVSHDKNKDFKKADFLSMSDADIYGALSRSFATEGDKPLTEKDIKEIHNQEFSKTK